MMTRIFAIGDIHGCSNTFKALIEKIELQRTDEVICIGDYIDRGKRSKGVIDFIMEMRRNNYIIHTLRGNHEQMMIESGSSLQHFSRWRINGGLATLNSFGVLSFDQLEQPYIDFFLATKYFIKTQDYIFAHAGLNFELENPLEDTTSMLWIRNFSADKTWLGSKLLIHGHTPKTAKYIKSQRFERGVINTDGGCVYNQRGMGNLFAVNLTNREFISVANCD